MPVSEKVIHFLDVGVQNSGWREISVLVLCENYLRSELNKRVAESVSQILKYALVMRLRCRPDACLDVELSYNFGAVVHLPVQMHECLNLFLQLGRHVVKFQEHVIRL